MIDEITSAIGNMISVFLEFIPSLIGAFLLYFIGKIVSGIVTKVAHKLLKAVKFDVAIDKSGLGAIAEKGGYPDSALLVAKIVGFIIFLIFIQLAVAALGIDAITDLVNSLIAWIPNLIVAIILIVITGAVANFVKGMLAQSLATVASGDLIAKVIVGFIWVLGGMMAIDQLGFGADIIDQLWNAVTTSLGAILVIKFGIGGIWAARDRFWPKVYDALDSGK